MNVTDPIGRLRVIVHRGTNEIGGSCIEVASATTRIILDCGWPLDGGDKSEPPSVPGLFAPGTKPTALLLSHAHPDHTGFIGKIPAGVPIYATMDTSKIMFVGSVYARGVKLLPERFREAPVPQAAGSCRPFQIGDLTVTAYPVDHSAYGAVGFLVEHGGRRVFYTGDLRFHGRKAGMSRRIVRDLRGKIDLLITEGTNVGCPSVGLSDEKNCRTDCGHTQPIVSVVGGSQLFAAEPRSLRFVLSRGPESRPDLCLRPLHGGCALHGKPVIAAETEGG